MAKVAEAAHPRFHRTLRDVESRLVIQHDDAVVSSHAVVGSPAEWHDHETKYPVVLCEGVVIRECARVHAGHERQTFIGEYTLVMSGAHIGHDVRVGERCNIAPNAVIGGCATIGDRVKIGMGATINPHVVVGDDVRIGAGAVVTKDIPSGETWAGVPARRLHAWRGDAS